MNTVKFATFKTIPEIHREIIYDKIIGIYNTNTGVFDMLDDTDNVNVIIKDEHIMNEKIVNENIMTVGFDKYNRVSEVINDTKYSYKFIIETGDPVTLETVLNDYDNDLNIINTLMETSKKLNLVKHDVKSHELKEKTYNFVAKQVEKLIDYDLSDVGVNIQLYSYNSYIPSRNDIIKIYNILLDNKDNFDELKTLKQCYQNKIIQHKNEMIDGHYKTILVKSFDLPLIGYDYKLELIQNLKSFMPTGSDITLKSYTKHIKVKINDIAYDWLNDYNKTSFITDINNILENKDC